MVTDRIDPYGGYNFTVELDGVTSAGFGECSGLENSTTPSEYRAGNHPHLSVRKVPGLVTYSDITLKRGITTDRKLFDWRQDVVEGKPEVRHEISITLRDDQGNDKITWNLFACWPRQWTGPTFNATEDVIAIEELVLVCERVEVDTWS